jgi:hypothetical protein
MLSVVMMTFIMMSIIILSGVLLSVIMLSVVMLDAVVPDGENMVDYGTGVRITMVKKFITQTLSYRSERDPLNALSTAINPEGHQGPILQCNSFHNTLQLVNQPMELECLLLAGFSNLVGKARSPL